MKKILAMAAVAALAAGASAYAANPFSDVSTSDWAYQAISDLSDRGMIEGYPDGSFKGQQNITRYEVAQIVARLMAKEDQMNAEDRAVIDRLASEYSAELQNLGVRVGNLEKKVGNIAWSGDARIRFQKTSGDNYGIKNNKFNGRIRLNARATVNDSTYVHGRLVANGNFDDTESDKDGKVEMDRIYVHHQFGKVGATLGRYELDLGQQDGGWLYAGKFDGIELAAPLGDKVSLALGYGRMKEPEGSMSLSATYNKVDYYGKLKSNFNKSEIFYAQLKADFKVAKIGFDYFKTSPYTWDFAGVGYAGDDPAGAVAGSFNQKKSVWGVNVLVPINKFRIFADYYADTKSNAAYSDKNVYNRDQKGKIWTIGLGYGAKDLQKAGSFNLDLAYFNVKAGLYEDGMTGTQAPSVGRLLMENGHFWLATGDVVVAKNTYVHGEYAFGAKRDEDLYTKEYGGSWTLSLNYKF